MNKKFTGIGVDAGMIMICDESYYEQYNYTKDPLLSQKFKLKNGNYNCDWKIPKSWNGKVEGRGILTVNSEKVIISDPCYCIGGKSDGFQTDGWDRWLSDTDYGNNIPMGCLILDKMGGDGCYTVHLKLKEI
jgi:hypothetical protein